MDPDYPLFAAVVDAGSLSAAGRVVGLSPAMVSKRIARMEERLGARLIHRTTRRLELTEIGARFHADVVAILGSARAAEARVRGTRDMPAGPLRVTAPTSFGRLHIAPLIPAFLDANPEVRLEFNLSDAFTDLLAERIDLAIRITPDVGPGLIGHRLGDSRRILCAAPAYLARFGAPDSVAALTDAAAGHRLLAAIGQMPWRLSDGRRGQAMLVEGESHVRTDSSEIVRELAIGGVGIALRSLWDVAEPLADGRLKRVLPDVEGSARVGIHAVRPAAPSTPPAVAAFIAHLEARRVADGWG